MYDLATDVEDLFAVVIACGDGIVYGWDLFFMLFSGLGELFFWKGILNIKVIVIVWKL